MKPSEPPDRSERFYYCGGCGEKILYSTPFHSHSSLSLPSMSPFCGACGKTLRDGFSPNATCSCEEPKIPRGMGE